MYSVQSQGDDRNSHFKWDGLCPAESDPGYSGRRLHGYVQASPGLDILFNVLQQDTRQRIPGNRCADRNSLVSPGSKPYGLRVNGAAQGFATYGEIMLQCRNIQWDKAVIVNIDSRLNGHTFRRQQVK